MLLSQSVNSAYIYTVRLLKIIIIITAFSLEADYLGMTTTHQEYLRRS